MEPGGFCCTGQSLGLVENWSQVDWNKMQYLIALGYTPWWLQPTPTASVIAGELLSVSCKGLLRSLGAALQSNAPALILKGEIASSALFLRYQLDSKK